MTPLTKLDPAVAAGLVGLVVIQLHNVYRSCAPALQDLRASDEDNWSARQALMDTDIYVGTLATVVGGATSLLIRRWEPLALALLGFGVISMYHHAVLNGGVVPKGDSK